MTPHLGPPLPTPLVPAADRPARGRVLDLPRRHLDLTTSVAVMGIVNVTPDSFYDRGATAAVGDAIERGVAMADAGAAIVDVGGVKGGPGTEVDADLERERIVPVVAGIRERRDVLISVDTYRAEVASAALGAGADIINDVGGGHDPEIAAVAAEADAGLVIMHRGVAVRSRPFRSAHRPDVTAAVRERLAELARAAREAGVHRDRIVLDPGHDFGKTTAQSLTLTRELPALAELGHPVLVALSNKDFIGETLDAPLDGRVDASLAAAVFSVLRGASIVRAHEVERTVVALRMTEALLGWRDPEIAVRGLE